MPTWAQWVTFGIAVLGAALGIFNAIVGWWRGRVMFRGEGTATFHDGFGTVASGVRVINSGRVPVNIVDVWLENPKTRDRVNLGIYDDLPVKIDGQDVREFDFDLTAMWSAGDKGAFCVVVKTATGQLARRDSKELRSIDEWARKR